MNSNFEVIATHWFDLTRQPDLAAWRSASERHFYDDHVRKVDGSTPTQASSLRPWIRCFTMNYLCLVEPNKQQIEEVRQTLTGN